MDNFLSSKLKHLKEELNNIEVKLNQSKLIFDDKNSIDNKTENELKFKLNWQLKEKLVSVLNDFTSLLNGDKNSIEKINDETNILIHNLIDLPFKLDDENITDSTNNQFKPTLIIDLDMKKEISDLLFRNKNFSIIYRDNVGDDAKLNLIKSNNNLIKLLNDLPLKMLIEDLNNCNQFITKSEFDEEMAKKDTEIVQLKKSISDKREVTFIYEFKNIDNFLKKSDMHFTPSFRCLGMDWYLRIILEDPQVFAFYLVLSTKLDSGRINVSSCIKIINREKKFSDETTSIRENDYRYQNKIYNLNSNYASYLKFEREFSYDHLKNNGFIKDDKIILQFYMKAELV